MMYLKTTAWSTQGPPNIQLMWNPHLLVYEHCLEKTNTARFNVNYLFSRGPAEVPLRVKGSHGGKPGLNQDYWRQPGNLLLTHSMSLWIFVCISLLCSVSNFVYLVVVVVVILEIGFSVCSLGCLEANSMGQAGFKLKEIHLPLLPNVLELKVCATSARRVFVCLITFLEFARCVPKASVPTSTRKSEQRQWNTTFFYCFIDLLIL